MTDRRRFYFEGERLRHRLENQSWQIEEVMQRHQVPSRVSGGEIREPWIRFNLQTTLASGLERMEGLKRELQGALDAAFIRFKHEQNRWMLDVKQRPTAPVELLPLLNELEELSPLSAVIGLSDDGLPLLLDLTAPDAAHVLIAGAARAGKSALIRAIAVSLALGQKQSQLQMIFMDGTALDTGRVSPLLRPLGYLPHALGPVLEDQAAMADTLRFLADEIDYRRRLGIVAPALILFIDGLEPLLAGGNGGQSQALARVAQSGAGAGIHLIASAADMSAPGLDALFLATLPVRLVGHYADRASARLAGGVSGVDTAHMSEPGTFVAVTPGLITGLQAAYVHDYDLHLCLEELHRAGSDRLLAQPVDGDKAEPQEPGRPFQVAPDEGRVAFADDGTGSAGGVGTRAATIRPAQDPDATGVTHPQADRSVAGDGPAGPPERGFVPAGKAPAANRELIQPLPLSVPGAPPDPEGARPRVEGDRDESRGAGDRPLALAPTKAAGPVSGARGSRTGTGDDPAAAQAEAQPEPDRVVEAPLAEPGAIGALGGTASGPPAVARRARAGRKSVRGAATSGPPAAAARPAPGLEGVGPVVYEDVDDDVIPFD